MVCRRNPVSTLSVSHPWFCLYSTFTIIKPEKHTWGASNSTKTVESELARWSIYRGWIRSSYIFSFCFPWMQKDNWMNSQEKKCNGRWNRKLSSNANAKTRQEIPPGAARHGEWVSSRKRLHHPRPWSWTCCSWKSSHTEWVAILRTLNLEPAWRVSFSFETSNLHLLLLTFRLLSFFIQT